MSGSTSWTGLECAVSATRLVGISKLSVRCTMRIWRSSVGGMRIANQAGSTAQSVREDRSQRESSESSDC